ATSRKANLSSAKYSERMQFAIVQPTSPCSKQLFARGISRWCSQPHVREDTATHQDALFGREFADK
ncbi:MAG: hypothetical protein AAFR90_13605, partial [Pseudomonadota bacterium]